MNNNMSRCINRLTAILALAESTKIIDRKKFITELQQIYLDEEFVEAINEISGNGDNKGSICWNHIMLTIHQVIVSEAKKNSTKASKGSSAAILQSGLCDVLKKTINLAISVPPISLCCSDLMSITFYILSNKIYEPYYKAYIGILESVLSNRMFKLSIMPEQWHQIMNTSLKMYHQSCDDMKRTLLEIQRMTVQYGSLQTNILSETSKVLQFLENVYKEIDSGQDIPLKLLYRLTYSVCQQIATENRITLCEFSEKIIPLIINRESCQEKWNVLILFMEIHHPGGAEMQENGAYAFNWDHWKNIIRGIFASIIRDMRSEILSPYFLTLACQVYKQMMLDSWNEEVTKWDSQFQEVHPQKRRRLSVPIRKPIDMLMANSDPETTWPSIQILTVLLKKYPENLTLEDYVKFLKSVSELVTASSNNESMLDSLCALCTVLVNIEKDKIFEAERKREDATGCWEKIWDTILRAISMNQNELLGHALLRSIMKNRGAVNPSGLVRLYVTRAIRWSPTSVKTLLTFCEHTSLPDELSSSTTGTVTLRSEGGSLRLSLISWCLEINTLQSFQIPIIKLASLLTILVGKSSYEGEFRDFRKSLEIPYKKKLKKLHKLKDDLFNNREGKFFQNLEQCLSSLNFGQKEEEEEEEEKKKKMIIIEEMKKRNDTKLRIYCVQEALEFFSSRDNYIISENSVVVCDLVKTLTGLTIIGKLLSNLFELNVRSEGEVGRLAKIFEEHLKRICSFIATTSDILNNEKIILVIEALEVLYSTPYHREVSKILIKSTLMKFLEFLYYISLEDNKNEIDDDDEENRENVKKYGPRGGMESKEEGTSCRRRNSAYKILTYFSCIPIENDMTDSQRRVFKNLMRIEIYESWSNTDLRRVLEFLKILGMENWIGMKEDSLEIVTNFIDQLYDSREKDEAAVRGILNVLPHFIDISMKSMSKGQMKKLLGIVTRINNHVIIEKYGSLLVHADLVQCISQIIKLDSSLSLKIGENLETQPLTEVLVNFIESPFYLVRLKVARALGDSVFSSNNISIPSKIKLFERIQSISSKLFSVEGRKLSESEKSDEFKTRANTVLQIFVAVIRGDEYLQNRALYWTIEVAMERNVDMKMVEKAMLCVTKTGENKQELIEKNLHYLLSRWFEDNHPLQLFAWNLLKCSSIEDFSRKHIKTLVSVKLERLEWKQVTILCSNVQVSFSQTMKNLFPTIITQLMTMIVDECEGDESERLLKSKYARQIFDKLRYNTEEFEKMEKFDIMLQDELSLVVTELVKKLRDERVFEKVFSRSVYLPSVNPPDYSVDTIDRCFSLLEKMLPVKKNNNVSLMEYLVINRPSVIQKVSENLFCDLKDCTGGEGEKMLAFQHYHYFGSIVLGELDKKSFDRMSYYMVRDTSYSLLSLTKEACFAEISCDYLYNYLVSSLPRRAPEIGEILSFIVSSLVPLVQSAARLVEPPLRILKYLIIEKKELLGEAIERLDSFPNIEPLKEIKEVHNSLKYGYMKNNSLKKEIEHFLNATNVEAVRCSHEELLHLKNQLSSRKQELLQMYADLEKLRGFTEDCASSTLHRLIYKLVQLTRSPDSQVSLEAANCLGELGPADLTTMILHPENNAYYHHLLKESDEDHLVMLTFHLVDQLLEHHLVDPNTKLRRATSEALYQIFSTPWGQALLPALPKIATSTPNKYSKLHLYIYPFVNDSSSSSKKTINLGVDRHNWQTMIHDDDDDDDSEENKIWKPVNDESYDKWIIQVTSNLSDCFVNFYTSHLKAVCQQSVEFCEILLPRLLNLLQSIDSGFVNDLFLSINRFFSQVYETLNDFGTTISDSPIINRDVSSLSHRCVRSMINVVNFLRIQSPETAVAASSIATINLDFLYIAKAAQYCSAYFTSILYAELWCQSLLLDSKLMQDKIPGSWISSIEHIRQVRPEPGKILQSIVREAYLHIGESDAIYRCGLSNIVDDPAYKIQRNIHLRRWDKVMLAQDVELSSRRSSSTGGAAGGKSCSATRGMLHALQQSGMHSILATVISSLVDNNEYEENFDDIMYDTAWRLADWNMVEPRRRSSNNEHHFDFHYFNKKEEEEEVAGDNDYHRWHYRALKCLRENDELGLNTCLEYARRSLVVSLSKISLECSQTLYPFLSQLQMLREIQDFAAIIVQSQERIMRYEQDNNRNNEEDIVEDYWKRRQDSLLGHDLKWVEPILSQRLVMYQSTEILGNLTNPALIKTHLDIAKIAEEQGYLSISARSLDSLSRRNLPESARDELTFREAYLAWKQDDRYMGRFLMKNLIKKKCVSPSLRARALRVYGNWMAATKLENPQGIVDKYFEDSIRTGLAIEEEIRSSEDVKNLVDAQADLAEFADSQYQRIVQFIQSPQYESLYECTKLKKDDRRRAAAAGRDEQKAIIAYQRQVVNDVAELENMNKEKNYYLLLATRYYLKTLLTGDEHDLLVFRLVSLWLDNTTGNDQLNGLLSLQLRSVPSYKFVILLAQLAPHMSHKDDSFSSKINELMERCAREHPHHTLPVLLALKNTHKDNDFKQPDSVTSGGGGGGGGGGSRGRRKTEKSNQEPRIRGAEKLIKKLYECSSLRSIICEMTSLFEALIALAYFTISDAEAKKKKRRRRLAGDEEEEGHEIPRNQPIMRIKDYTSICVPTMTIEVKPRGNYDNVIGVVEYGSKFDLPGGVNAPKKIVCLGSDGIKRVQLVKGQDDLRQDAVMQQVFTVMNSMLAASKESRKRKLHIRVYKIVPLSQRSGILEWCQDTLPISQILCDSPSGERGIHSKYYPDDWTVSKCRGKLQAVDRAPNELKLQAFLECCKHLRPAFHHFFLEKYPSPETWFERRYAYIRSVATTSMVGYVLGLGDRHLSNILIDQTTAEVIHIDFGIAFAQGKVLPIPETVPFRLTRDMEVAMGLGGVDGVMTRSCEETVTVLRDKTRILITLLQVLLYDPLFTWAIAPVRSNDDDDDDDDHHHNLGQKTISHEQGRKKTNKLAQRALLKIEQKLQGTEDGGINSCISGQVERLIQQARDPFNLCRLYSGWQAYL